MRVPEQPLGGEVRLQTPERVRFRIRPGCGAERAAAEAELAALREIPREALSETDQLAYDVFEYQKKQSIAGLVDELVALQVVRPVNHFQGFHTFYPVLASGQGAAPFNTVEDYENNLKRHAQFVELTDRAIARFREAIESFDESELMHLLGSETVRVEGMGALITTLIASKARGATHARVLALTPPDGDVPGSLAVAFWKG